MTILETGTPPLVLVDHAPRIYMTYAAFIAMNQGKIAEYIVSDSPVTQPAFEKHNSLCL